MHFFSSDSDSISSVYSDEGKWKSPAIQENPSSPAPNEPVDAK